jgi:hypothetical protein
MTLISSFRKIAALENGTRNSAIVVVRSTTRDSGQRFSLYEADRWQ